MKVFKYRSGDDTEIEEGKSAFLRDLQSLKNNSYYASNHEQLNDPCETLILTGKFTKQASTLSSIFGRKNTSPLLELENAMNNLFNVHKNNIGIYSLSQTYKDELLWAHYGNSHKGFCIEYDLNTLLNSYKSRKLYSFPINYSNKPPEFTINQLDSRNNNDQIVKKMAGYKSLRWQYEQEHRIVTGFSGLEPYDPSALKAIYFGLNMKSELKEKMMETLKGRKIQFYQIVQIKDSYEFDKISINDVTNEELTYFKIIPNKISGNGDINMNIISKDYSSSGKCEIIIEIEKPITKKALTWLANKIKNELFGKAKTIYAFYYLMDDPIKKGAWSTTHYTDSSSNLVINIIGPTQESYEILNSLKIKGNVLNVWRNNDSMLYSKIFLIKEDSKLLLKTYRSSTDDPKYFEIKEIVTENNLNGKTRYDCNNHREYYLIEPNGNLGQYEQGVKINEAIKDTLRT